MTSIDLEFAPKWYVSKVTQVGVAAPTDAVVYNTLMQPAVWTYQGVGSYRVQWVFPFFAASKAVYWLAPGQGVFFQWTAQLFGGVGITFTIENQAGAATDALLNAAPFFVVYFP